MSAAWLLAACGSGGGSPASTPQQVTGSRANAGTPTKGGTLRIASFGNGTSETYNPALLNTPIDVLHGYSVFDPLVRPAANYKTSPGLALTWTPSADNRAWELALRQGVTWHDGKPFTADDVLYTLRGMGSPSHFGHGAVRYVDLRGMKKLNDHLIRIPLTRPVAQLQDYFIYFNSALMVQDGAKDFSKPVGTGPYKLVSFTPGERSVLTANRDYWDDPYPYPDGLEILSIDDDAARLNALQSNQADIITPLNASQAKAHLHDTGGAFQVLVGAPGQSMNFYMRTDKAPFDDVRVRQAIRLLADRDAMIGAAFAGIGKPGNDLMGNGLPFFATDLPQRTQDIEQAKSLLKQAGRSDLRVTLEVSPVFAGLVESATVLSQQAKLAGVTIDLKRVQPSTYLNPTLSYLKMPFAGGLWPTASLNQIYSSTLLSDSPVNETHFASKSFDRKFLTAQGANTLSKQQAAWTQLQQVQYDQGGYLVWCYTQTTDAYGPRVRGLDSPGSGWLYQLNDFNVWKWGLGA